MLTRHLCPHFVLQNCQLSSPVSFFFHHLLQSSLPASSIPASPSEATPSQDCPTYVHVSVPPSLLHTAFSFVDFIVCFFVFFSSLSTPQRLSAWPQVFSLLQTDFDFSICQYIKVHKIPTPLGRWRHDFQWFDAMYTMCTVCWKILQRFIVIFTIRLPMLI